MYVPSKIPRAAAPKLMQWIIRDFKGVDLTSAPANMLPNRASDAPNIMPDLEGKPRVRTGHHLIKKYPDRINGSYKLVTSTGDKKLRHTGTNIYLVGDVIDTLLWNTAADDYSVAFQVGGYLWIADGTRLLRFDGTTIIAADTVAYIPTICISRTPTGGGKTYQAVNLLQGKRTDSFYISAANDAATVFQLSFKGLDATLVTAVRTNSDGSTTNYTESSGIASIDRTNGKVTFTTKPGQSPTEGVDSLTVTYSLTSKADQINKCRIGTLFGVSGASNKLFLTGNTDKPNLDWYCQDNDPTYWGDIWYSQLGQDSSPVVGYSKTGNKLAAHKKNNELANIYIRQGTLDSTNNPVFSITSTITGEGAVAPHSFNYLSNEPLFMTSLGFFAITTMDITAEQYTQQRSYYINKVIEKYTADQMAAAYSCIWKNFYVVAIADRLYLIDGNQKQYEKNAPLSSFQYECYYFSNINARIVWSEGDTLYYGTADGSVEAFYTDVDDINCFNDNGVEIPAYWTTPEFIGTAFYKAKDVQFLSVKLAPTHYSGVDIYYYYDGAWIKLQSLETAIRYLDFNYINFNSWTFITDQQPRTVGQKTTLRGLDKTRFKFECNGANSQFGIFEIAVEYTENGYYK